LSEPSLPARSPAEQAAILKALNSLLDDPAFEASARNKRFLRFVVEETLAGRGDRIKSYSIAVDVFGRTPDFDGSVDPIVRIEASRLRTSLANYYANAGNEARIQFSLPRGGYVPEFREFEDDAWPAASDAFESERVEPGALREAGESDRRRRDQLRWGALAAGLAAAFTLLIVVLVRPWAVGPVHEAEPPMILVDQVEALTDDAPTRILARTLSESLVSALQQFDGLAISRKPRESTEAVARLLKQNADRSVYQLASELRIDHDTVHLWWHLSDLRTTEVYWTATQEGPWKENATSAEAEIAQKVATAVAYRNGLVKSLEARTIPDPPPPGYLCVLRVQRYVLLMDPKNHAVARDCLERTVALSPYYADAWAYLAIIYNDEVRNRYNPDHSLDAVLAKAKDAASKAQQLAPYSAMAYKALMVVDFTQNDYRGFEDAFRRAIEISPADPEVLVYGGNRLWSIGRFEEGVALVRKALAINTNPGPLEALTLALDEYRLGHYQQTIALLRLMPADSLYLVPMLYAATYGQLGDRDAARPHIARLLEVHPNFAHEFRDDFHERHIVDSYADAVADGLRKAGLGIVEPTPRVDTAAKPNQR